MLVTNKFATSSIYGGGSSKPDTSYSTNLGNGQTTSGNKPPKKPITFDDQLSGAGQTTPETTVPETTVGAGTETETPTTENEAVDTYEEFLLKQQGYYKEQLDKLTAQIEQNRLSAIQLAEQQRQQIEKQAETERQRGVIDARSSYAQNLATYGANAEQLAAMGLSGSGYSEYLNQQAYATQRSETQNANAQAQTTKLNAQSAADAAKLEAEQQANADRMNAELSYAQNMQNNAMQLAQYQQQKAEKEKAEIEQKNQYYEGLLASANAGNYTSEQLASLGAQYGLSETQISQLQSAANSNKEQMYAENYATLLDQMLSEMPDDYDGDNRLEIKEQDRNKIVQFLEENKGSLGEQLYNFYKNQIDTIEVYSEKEQQAADEAAKKEQQAEIDKQIITGNDSIEYDGRYYKLDSRLNKDANQIVRNNDFKKKLKALGYSDPFDKNIPNGTTIKSNVDNKGAHDFNFWDDIGAAILSPATAGAWDSWANWNEINMTYYNGNWYLSSEV